jgi:hypothetical protein
MVGAQHCVVPVYVDDSEPVLSNLTHSVRVATRSLAAVADALHETLENVALRSVLDSWLRAEVLQALALRQTFGQISERWSYTLARYPRPEVGYWPVLGIVRCAQKHGPTRTNAGCERASPVPGASALHRKIHREHSPTRSR